MLSVFLWYGLCFSLNPSPARISGMAATNTVDETGIPPDNWGPQDESAMGPGNNGLAGPGVALPVDDRSAPQDSENPEYPRGSSASENDAYREKQVKVLRFFLVCLAPSFGASWVWQHSRWQSSASALCFDPLFDFLYWTGVYFLLRSRTRSTLVVFQSTRDRKTCKVALAK
jgi:hypothetical protein